MTENRTIKTLENGKTFVLRGDRMTLLVFSNLEAYKDWDTYTAKHGNDMTSFYKIDTMITKYSQFTDDELAEYYRTE